MSEIVAMPVIIDKTRIVLFCSVLFCAYTVDVRRYGNRYITADAEQLICRRLRLASFQLCRLPTQSHRLQPTRNTVICIITFIFILIRWSTHRIGISAAPHDLFMRLPKAMRCVLKRQMVTRAVIAIAMCTALVRENSTVLSVQTLL